MAVLAKRSGVLPAEEKEVGRWLTRIKIGESFRDAEGRKAAWKNMKQMYRNIFKEDVISVPLIYSHGRQMVPFLYFKNPVVECTPLQRGYGRRAKILEAVDNMLLQEMRVKEQLKLIIQDAFLYDYGIRKIGYDSEFGYDDEGSMWGDLFKEMGIEVSKEELIEYNTYVIEEFPFFLRVPPRRFIVDPDIEGPTLDTARWCVEEFYRPLQDVVDDDRYTVPKNLKATYMLNKDAAGNIVVSPNFVGNEGRIPDARYRSDSERVKLWEVWDKKNGEVLVIADGHNGYLRKTEDVWGLKDFFPYDRLCFNPVSDEHFSTSDAMYVEKQQMEFNDARTQEMLHRRKENTKWISKRNVLNPEEKAKFAAGHPGIMVEIDGIPGTDLMAVTSQMSGDIYRVSQDIRNDMMETLSVGKNQLSQEMGKRKTAHEAEIINQYTELRADERRDIVADFLQRAIGGINTLVFKFWDSTDVIRIMGDEGMAWEEWNGDALQGEYAIQVIPNSTLPHSKEAWQGKIEKIYQTLVGNPFVNLKEITRLYLDSFEEFDTSKILIQVPGETPSMADFRPGDAKMQDDASPPQAMPPAGMPAPGSPPGAPAQAVSGPGLPAGSPGQRKA